MDKTTKEVRITLRYSKDMHTRLTALAERERRSLNAQILKAIEEHLDRQLQPPAQDPPPRRPGE